MRNYYQRRKRAPEFQDQSHMSSSSQSFFGTTNSSSRDQMGPPPVPMMQKSAPVPMMQRPQKFQQYNKWSSGMDSHSKLIINNDPQNLSHLSSEDQMQIKIFQNQIDELKTRKMPKKPLSAFEIFENKNFNGLKSKNPKQTTTELKEMMDSIWFKNEGGERPEYEKQAKELQQVYHIEMEDNTSKVNQLKQKIHEIRFPFFQNVEENSDLNQSNSQHYQAQAEAMGYGTQIKPSGKIKFMSAYRFFRKEMVPIIKKQEVELDGKGRHAVVHDLWQQLQDRHKLAYVLMSRADREKSLYIIRLNQIREELRQAYPREFGQVQTQQKQEQDEKENPVQEKLDQKLVSFDLEHIEEIIIEEPLSDENFSDNEETPTSIPNLDRDFDRAEHLKTINEKRAKEVQRVLPKYMAIFDRYDQNQQQSHNNGNEDISPCLINLPIAQITRIKSNYQSDSIFSKSFQENNRWQENKNVKYQ